MRPQARCLQREPHRLWGYWLGTILLLQGDYEGAGRRFDEGLTLGRRISDRLSICNAIFNLAQLALADGDHEAAFRWFA